MNEVKHQRLFLFESEAEINEAMNAYRDSVSFPDVCTVASIAKGRFLDGITTLYAITGAANAFTDCGIEQDKLERILELNALMCALATFKHLSSTQTEFRANSLTTDDKKTDRCYWINQIRSNDDGFYKTVLDTVIPSPGYQTCQFLKQIADFLIDNYIELDKDLVSWNSALNRAFTIAKNENTLPNTSNKAMLDANKAYADYYSCVVKLLQNMQRPADRLENAVLDYLIESIFHIRALSCCEKEIDLILKSVKYGSTSMGEVPQKCEPALFKLILRRTVPLVFAADSMSFRGSENFGCYIDFIKLTTILAYNAAVTGGNGSKVCEDACKLLQKCLSMPRYGTLISRAQYKNKARRDKGKSLIQRTEIAMHCFNVCGFGCYYAYEEVDLDTMNGKWLSQIYSEPLSVEINKADPPQYSASDLIVTPMHFDVEVENEGYESNLE